MSANEHEVRREVTLLADRAEVWECLTEPELAEQWLADEAELDLREGGEVVFRYEDGEERRGEIEELEPEERLRIRWRRPYRCDTAVEFVLADAAAGTRLVVVEWAPAAGPQGSASAWAPRLFALEVMSLLRGAAAVPSG